MSGVAIAILLAHLKKDASEVKKALLSLDEGLLTPECLKQLIDFAPDDDEVLPAVFIAWWLRVVVKTLDLRLLVADSSPGHDTAW